MNREYILKRLDDIEDLKKQIEDMEDILSSKARVKKIIVGELNQVIDKYGKDRRTEIIYAQEIEDMEDVLEEVPDYPVTLFFTKEGYITFTLPAKLVYSVYGKLLNIHIYHLLHICLL